MRQRIGVGTKKIKESQWIVPSTNNAGANLISPMLAGGAASGHLR